MRKRIGIIRDGKYYKADEIKKEAVGPKIFGIQDTMNPLRHPVTSEIIDSRSHWNAINKEHGLVCSGNELLSNKKRETKEVITDEVILDRMDRAEAILADPAKMRARENENIERYEEAKRCLRWEQ